MKKGSISFKKVILVLFFLIVAFFTVYPLVYVVSASFAPGQSISSLNIVPFKDGFTLDHFKYLFQNTDYLLWYKNTLIISASTAFLTVIIASISAYVFSRFRFKLKKTMMITLLVLQIFPSMLSMIAVYVLLLRIDGLDQLWGLVLIYVAGNIPYNTWLVKSYIDTIPRSLDDAAKIDGANSLQTFIKIIVPMTAPILSFLAIVTFTAPWMDFIFPKLILRSSENQTLALGLFNFVTDKKGEFATFAAGSLLVAIPFVIFFLFSQKTMISSLGAGAVKE